MTTLSSKVIIPKNIIYREVGGEMVLLNVDSGKYFGLDDVGARMWTVLSEHDHIGNAYQALLEEYDVDEERLCSDLLELVARLSEQNLIQVVDS